MKYNVKRKCKSKLQSDMQNLTMYFDMKTTIYDFARDNAMQNRSHFIEFEFSNIRKHVQCLNININSQSHCPIALIKQLVNCKKTIEN